MIGYILAYAAIGLPIAAYTTKIATIVSILSNTKPIPAPIIFFASWLLFPIVLLLAAVRLLLNLLPFEFEARRK